MKLIRCLIASVLLLASSHVAGAATAAYWRMEEGPAGAVLPSGADTLLDSSENGNHMRTFDPVFTSPDYTTTVSPLALRSGETNALALNFGPGGVDEDRFQTPIGRDDDVYTDLKGIQTQLFTAMTVELAFKMDVVSGFQALFGRDGKPIGDAVGEDDSPVPPFKIAVRGDDFPDAVPNQLFIEWIDGDATLLSDVHFLATRETVVPNQWYHVAFTLTATDAQLWVAGESGDYELKDSASGDYAGTSGEVWAFDTTPLTIGRGAFGNGIVDWVDATIDEVRVSDAALAPSEFLFVTAPGGAGADFNGNGVVDGGDFLTWQRAFGGPGSDMTGDATGDGQVNGADYAEWASKFGGPPAVAAGAPVPEPSAWTLAALASACVRRRTRS